MPANSTWFDHPEQLLGELQRTVRRGVAPTIPGYDEFQELRRGGQGIVYRAVQRSTHRTVAVKVLLDGAYASASARRRFEREIDLVAGLRHPNIVRVFDGGADAEGRPFCVMEFIEGCSLDDLLVAPAGNSSAGVGLPAASPADPGGGAPAARASSSAAALAELRSGARRIVSEKDAPGGVALGIPAALRLFLKVCNAVQYAHQRGVIHRDLKPSNIRVDPSGEPHVLDFGLAKAATDTDPQATQMTRSGHFLGSLPWASPEQAAGAPDLIDLRSDVYSLGVMLYQILTGRFPYSVTGNIPEVLGNILRAEPVRPRTIRREIDEDLETILLKSLAKDPARRYQSAGEFADDLRRYLNHEPVSAKRDSAWYVTRKLLRRYRVVAIVAGILLVAVAGFGATMTVMYQRTLAAKGQADAATRQAKSETRRATETHRFLERMLGSISPARARTQDTALLREVLDEASRKLDSELADQPGAAAALHVTIGDTYGRLGLYQAAAEHLRKAAALYSQESGPDDFGVMQAQVALLEVLLYDQRVAEVRPLLADLQQRAPAILGPEHQLAIKVIHAQAKLDQLEGRFAAAEANFRRVYELKNRLNGPEDTDTITCMSDLAIAMMEIGQAAEAEPMFREVLAARRRILGDDHPDTLVSMNMLGLIRQELGDLAEAETLQRAALELSRRVLGPEHPDTLTVLSNLGTVAQGLGKYAEAVALLDEAVESRRRVLGPDNPATLTALSNLGDVYRTMGRLDDAEKLYIETIATTRRVQGDQCWDLAICLNNLAQTRMSQKRFAEAEESYREAVQIARAVLPPGNYQLGLLDGNYGKCLIVLGRFAEAETLLLPAYDSLLKALGPENGFVRGVRKSLGELYEAWDKPGEAEKWKSEGR